jgi:hypothetical protein
MSAQYFAEVDADNVVVRVNAVQKSYMDANPNLYPGLWVETFIDKPNTVYAGIGYKYDPTTQEFIPPVIE